MRADAQGGRASSWALYMVAQSIGLENHRTSSQLLKLNPQIGLEDVPLSYPLSFPSSPRCEVWNPVCSSKLGSWGTISRCLHPFPRLLLLANSFQFREVGFTATETSVTPYPTAFWPTLIVATSQTADDYRLGVILTILPCSSKVAPVMGSSFVRVLSLKSHCQPRARDGGHLGSIPTLSLGL